MEWQAVEDGSPAPNEISYISAAHSNSLLNGLKDLRDETTFCDVILRIGENTFPAHKCVLATFSPYFKAMFTIDLWESHNREVTLNDIEPAVLESLLEFFYTGTVGITQGNVQGLVAASNLLQVLWVRDACSMFMARHIDASNCLGIQCFAETMNCEKLHDTAKEFALNNLPELADHEEFLNLPLARLVELVSSDALDVPREEEVFTAVLRWFNHQPDARKDDFHKVLECVRLPLMSPRFLYNPVSKQEVIQTSPESLTLLQEALLYHLLPEERADMQSARARPRRSNKLVDVIVCVGGNEGLSTLRSLEAFEPVSKRWSSLCDLPIAINSHGAVVTERNTLYVAGGYTSTRHISLMQPPRSNRLLKFDPDANEWEEMASMNCARSAHGLAVLDGFIYAVGGRGDTGTLASVERYNIETNQWEQLPALLMATCYATVLAHDGCLYVAGGEDDIDIMRGVQRFDPRTRIWTGMAPMLIPRTGAAGCVLDGKLFIIGGVTDITSVINQVECYDAHSNTWNFCSPMSVMRGGPGIAVMGGNIYVLGGEANQRAPLTSVERYTPATGRWEDVPEMTMTSPRSRLACAALKIRKSLLPQ